MFVQDADDAGRHDNFPTGKKLKHLIRHFILSSLSISFTKLGTKRLHVRLQQCPQLPHWIHYNEYLSSCNSYFKSSYCHPFWWQVRSTFAHYIRFCIFKCVKFNQKEPHQEISLISRSASLSPKKFRKTFQNLPAFKQKSKVYIC